VRAAWYFERRAGASMTHATVPSWRSDERWVALITECPGPGSLRFTVQMFCISDGFALEAVAHETLRAAKGHARRSVATAGAVMYWDDARNLRDATVPEVEACRKLISYETSSANQEGVLQCSL